MPKRCILSFNPHHNNSGRYVLLLFSFTDGEVITEKYTDPLAQDHPVSKHRVRTLSGSLIPAPHSQWLLFIASRKRSQTRQHQHLVGLVAPFLILNQHISSVHYTVTSCELISMIQVSGTPSLNSGLRRQSFQTCKSSCGSMTGPQESDGCREWGGRQGPNPAGLWTREVFQIALLVQREGIWLVRRWS